MIEVENIVNVKRRKAGKLRVRRAMRMRITMSTSNGGEKWKKREEIMIKAGINMSRPKNSRRRVKIGAR